MGFIMPEKPPTEIRIMHIGKEGRRQLNRPAFRGDHQTAAIRGLLRRKELFIYPVQVMPFRFGRGNPFDIAPVDIIIFPDQHGLTRFIPAQEQEFEFHVSLAGHGFDSAEGKQSIPEP